MKRFRYLVLLVVIISLGGCNKDDDDSDYQEQLSKDIQLIEDYLEENGLEAQKTSSGLYYIINTEGDGDHPTSSSTVTVQYKGYLLDGTEFDANTATFSLSGVIAGWTEGIPKFKAKGRGNLLIPSGLGYGAYPSGDIPANSVLIFDIHLISFQ